MTDDSKRIEILDKLNKDICAYNKWSDGRLEYPDLDEYSPWSFLVVRADLEYVDKKLYLEIIDEELYKLKKYFNIKRYLYLNYSIDILLMRFLRD